MAFIGYCVKWNELDRIIKTKQMYHMTLIWSYSPLQLHFQANKRVSKQIQKDVMDWEWHPLILILILILHQNTYVVSSILYKQALESGFRPTHSLRQNDEAYGLLQCIGSFLFCVSNTVCSSAYTTIMPIAKLKKQTCSVTVKCGGRHQSDGVGWWLGGACPLINPPFPPHLFVYT